MTKDVITDLYFDDGDRIEICDSYPNAATAIQALKDDPRYELL